MLLHTFCFGAVPSDWNGMWCCDEGRPRKWACVEEYQIEHVMHHMMGVNQLQLCVPYVYCLADVMLYERCML
jgi:hypothetical protein